jgi:hypothetical protein
VKELAYSATGAQPILSTTLPGSAASVIIDQEGETTLTFFARDQAGNTEQSKTLVIKLDKTPPTLDCRVNPNRLWPPNHKLVSVTATVQVTDALSGAAGFLLTAVDSDETDDGQGDGNQPNDIQGFQLGTPDRTGQLRAERAGGGDGRVYTLTYQATDQAGNSQTCAAEVNVPHDASDPTTTPTPPPGGRSGAAGAAGPTNTPSPTSTSAPGAAPQRTATPTRTLTPTRTATPTRTPTVGP